MWKPGKLVYNTRLITYRINDKRTSLIPTNRVSECALGKIFGVFRLIEVHCALGIHPLVMNDDNIVFLTGGGAISTLSPRPRRSTVSRGFASMPRGLPTRRRC